MGEPLVHGVSMPALTQKAYAPLRERGKARDTIRAIFLLNSLAIGGSETKIVRVANALARRGVRTGIAYLNTPCSLADSIAPEVPVWHLGRRGKFSIAALRKLAALVREQRPSAVLSVNLYPSLYNSLASVRAPRRIALLNTTHFVSADQWRRTFYVPFLRRLDGIVYGCDVQRREWMPRLGTARPVRVIYNGVDTEQFSPAESERHRDRARGLFGIAPGAFVVGSVGRFITYKNHEALIDTLVLLRAQSLPAHLLLVGDGPLRPSLEIKVAKLGLERYVTFAGLQRDVRIALSAMDVFVLPSTHVETFSNAALEAMAMGKPVVLSRIGGATEMISEGVEGFTIERQELAAQLPVLLAKLQADRNCLERLGFAARMRVERCFSLDRMALNYEALIDGSSEPVLQRETS